MRSLVKKYAVALTALLKEKSVLAEQRKNVSPEERAAFTKRRKALNREIRSMQYNITQCAFLDALYVQIAAPENLQTVMDGIAATMHEAELPAKDQAEILECVMQNLQAAQSTQEGSR